MHPLIERTRPFWSAKHVIEVLELDGRAVLERAVTDGEVLGLLTSDGILIFPVWQFHDVGGGVTVRPGLRPILMALRDVDSWTVALWLRMPSPEIGGRSAWALANEDPESEVLRNLVQQVAREWGGDPRW